MEWLHSFLCRPLCPEQTGSVRFAAKSTQSLSSQVGYRGFQAYHETWARPKHSRSSKEALEGWTCSPTPSGSSASEAKVTALILPRQHDHVDSLTRFRVCKGLLIQRPTHLGVSRSALILHSWLACQRLARRTVSQQLACEHGERISRN